MVDITDWNDLYSIHDDYTATYNLQNNLDKNTAGYSSIASDTANSGKGFEPIGSKTDNNGNTQFKGVINGNGYTISDLYIDRPNENNTGFVAVGYGTLENVLFSNAYIKGSSAVGIWGDGSRQDDFGGAYLENIAVDSSSTITGGDKVGSIVGNTADRTYLYESYSLATVNSDNQAGGLAGVVASSFSVRMTFQRCYYAGDITAGGRVDPLGYAGLSTGEDNYWDEEKTGLSSSTVGGTGLSTSQMTGSNAPNNMTALDFSSTGNWKVVSNDYPDLKNLERKQDLISTLQPDDVDGQGFLAKGEVTEIASSSLEIGFDYRQVGESNFRRVIVDTISSPQEYSYEFDTLLAEDEYEYKAVAFKV